MYMQEQLEFPIYHTEHLQRLYKAVANNDDNYYNFINLYVVGAGLDKFAKYSETTSDSVCTQYSSRNCAKY